MSGVKFYIPGETQLMIIRAAIADGKFTCLPGAQLTAATKANGHGYLDRDKRDGKVWYPTEKASAMLAFLAEREAEAEGASPAVVGRDMFGLVDTVLRAQSLLDDGDVLAAKQLAGGAYLDAKARAQYAASFGAAGKRVVAKARQLQGDALLIETRAKMSIAAAWDAAQADGRALKGRPKSISDENTFTQAEAGITAKEIHDARKMLEAEEKAPGFAERAIAARVAAGFEPSRANLRAAVGTASATKEERGQNLYETPEEATRVLLALERFSSVIWEPSCGRGAIAAMLEAAGHEVILTDLIDYGTADASGTVMDVRDFFATTPEAMQEVSGYRLDDGVTPDIVTNPPYGAILNAYVAHALRVHRPRKMALLLNLNFLCGFADDDRNFVMDEQPPCRVYIFTRRLPMMHRDGWDGPKASSRMNTAWFVWERDEAGNYGDSTWVKRVNWADYAPQAEPVTAESEAA